MAQKPKGRKSKRFGKKSAYYARQVFVTQANKLRRALQRKRKAESPATAKRKVNRLARALARKQANILRRQRIVKAQPISAFTPQNPATQTL